MEDDVRTAMESAVNREAFEMIAVGVDHPEGIAVTPSGTLYVGGEAGQIYRIDKDEAVEVASSGGFHLGLASDAEGRIYAIDNVAKCVWRYTPGAAGLEKWLTSTDDAVISVPNWGAFGPDGSYYLTDSGDWGASNGRIWVRRPGGSVELLTDKASDFPNGCALSADGETLYFVTSNPGGVCELSLTSDIAEPVLLHDLGQDVPDGIAVATDGSLIIACYRPDVIYRWSHESGLEVLASDPQGTVLSAPTNVAFMGEGNSVLVVPNLGRWHVSRAKLGVSGVALFYPTQEQLDGVAQ